MTASFRDLLLDPDAELNSARLCEIAVRAWSQPHVAAIALDRAYGLNPSEAELREKRMKLLDQLSITEKGVVFRYIPEGFFFMGSDEGDSDERPVHLVKLGDYWLSETPVSWTLYCHLMGWRLPPIGSPIENELAVEESFRNDLFQLSNANKLRVLYGNNYTDGIDGICELSSERADPNAYDEKPMVAVSWQDADKLCSRISSPEITYRLPTEAEWEKAARGGLVKCRFPWGNEPAVRGRNCDCDRFEEFSILRMRTFPPNGYGLYSMSGGVWEWTQDWYDEEYYKISPLEAPAGPHYGEEKVMRGGSWADCAQAATVSFRTSLPSRSWKDPTCHLGLFNPNVGFRICRIQRTAVKIQSLSALSRFKRNDMAEYLE